MNIGGVFMKDIKVCSLFKDLYAPYLNEELEDQAIYWMQEHLKSCISCKKWAENYTEKIDLEKDSKDKLKPLQGDEMNVIKKARIFLMVGITIVAALALWMSLWIVS